ncbi:PIN domain-containing protein [Chitinophaga filiformis]|uniref:PIN domain-containing protein n=1 Tax=Chitinophaga filiformis TaxID=104663 RepID=UPI001F1E9BBF|nr:PIN domain-containing protein [Chitinophaga filiformis]MCF6407515.1 PIN domain-containing protein [Chitinophaga filiformis]
MPILLLIDTCIWKVLVSKNDYGHYLRQLEHWVENKEVELLIPPQLTKEWEKHREMETNIIKQRINKAEKDIRSLRLLHHQDITVNMEVAETRLIAQIDAIDKLMADGIQLEDNEHAIIRTYKLKVERKPPFAAKLDSDSDAMMLFNSMCYINTLEEKQFFFVSANTNEFSFPENSSQFHPELQEEYPKVVVNYYTSQTKCFAALQAIGLSSLPNSEVEVHISKEVFSINKTAPLLDQLYQYMQVVFHEWSFLPLKFFARQYPFIVKSNTEFIPQPFILFTDNKEVRDLLADITYQNGTHTLANPKWAEGVDSVDKKVGTIATNLAHNLAHFLRYKDDKTERPFFSFNYLKTNTSLAAYLRFDYIDLFGIQEISTDDAYTLLTKAYIMYELGFFKEAVAFLQSAQIKAEHEPRRILQYIANYNLVKSIRFLRTLYWDNTSQESLIKKLRKIDLSEIFSYVKTNENEAILQWIHSSAFYNETLLKIHDTVTRIRKTFYARSTGFNQDFDDLRFAFYQISGFITFNGLFYDQFSEFESVSKAFLEGVLASYGCSSDLSGKLAIFTDDLLLNLVRHCDHENIKHLINRYKITELRYLSAEEGASFVDLFLNFLHKHDAVWSAHDTSKKVDTIHFRDTYYRVFGNFLTITSYLELDAAKLNNIAVALLSFLQCDQRQMGHAVVKLVTHFMERKGGVIAGPLLNNYLHVCVLDKRLNNEVLVHYITEHLSENNWEVTISTTEFELFRATYLDSKYLFANDHYISVISSYFSSIRNENYRQQIRKFVTNTLDSEFNHKLFYYATIHNIIITTNEQHVAFHEAMRIYILKTKDDRLRLSKSHYTNQTIDSYLNFVFKENYDLPQEVIAALVDLGPYYDWLLHLDTFDYVKFDYRWLYNYWTIYYRARYKASTALKRCLLDIIRKQPQSNAQGVFMNIYHSGE